MSAPWRGSPATFKMQGRKIENPMGECVLAPGIRKTRGGPREGSCADIWWFSTWQLGNEKTKKEEKRLPGVVFLREKGGAS